jgi:hypothetical protein
MHDYLLLYLYWWWYLTFLQLLVFTFTWCSNNFVILYSFLFSCSYKMPDQVSAHQTDHQLRDKIWWFLSSCEFHGKKHLGGFKGGVLLCRTTILSWYTCLGTRILSFYGRTWESWLVLKQNKNSLIIFSVESQLIKLIPHFYRWVFRNQDAWCWSSPLFRMWRCGEAPGGWIIVWGWPLFSWWLLLS